MVEHGMDKIDSDLLMSQDIVNDEGTIFSLENEKVDQSQESINIFDAYKDVIKKYPILSKSEEFSLFEILKNDNNSLKEKNDARDKLIYSNIRLVLKDAVYYNRATKTPVADLVNSGIEGLCMAIDKFDMSLGFKLSTYAHCWIRKSVIDCVIANNISLHIPRDILNKMISDCKRFEDNEDVKIFKNIMNLLSLDAPLVSTGDEKIILSDVIPEEKYTEETISDDNILNILSQELDKLSERELYVIKQRWLSQERSTLIDIGKQLDYTGEYIRQVEEKAMKKLRKRMQKYEKLV